MYSSSVNWYLSNENGVARLRESPERRCARKKGASAIARTTTVESTAAMLDGAPMRVTPLVHAHNKLRIVNNEHREEEAADDGIHFAHRPPCVV